MLSLSSLGYGYCYVAGAKSTRSWPHAFVDIEAHDTPKFSGSVSEFIQAYSGPFPHIVRQLSNTVKICPKCRKSCAFSLSTCNNCSQSLVGEPISRGDNSLTGFIYGIRYCQNYDLGTSIRYEDRHFFVYDDIMQTTMIHLNSIPTFVYIPDFRYLFSRPMIGLGIVKDLYRVGKIGAKKMFEQDAFVEKFYSVKAKEEMNRLGVDEWIDANVFAGFNYPPSQCQLHLQFILPPYVPYHSVLLSEGKHGDLGRFFPYKFLVRVLETAVERSTTVPIEEIEKMTGTRLAEYLSEKFGVDYSAYFEACVRQNERVSDFCANWDSNDFEYVVIDKRIVVRKDTGQVESGISAVDLIKKDQGVFQSYGKQHKKSEGEGVKLQYYSFAREPGSLPDWENYSN